MMVPLLALFGASSPLINKKKNIKKVVRVRPPLTKLSKSVHTCGLIFRENSSEVASVEHSDLYHKCSKGWCFYLKGVHP